MESKSGMVPNGGMEVAGLSPHLIMEDRHSTKMVLIVENFFAKEDIDGLFLKKYAYFYGLVHIMN